MRTSNASRGSDNNFSEISGDTAGILLGIGASVELTHGSSLYDYLPTKSRYESGQTPLHDTFRNYGLRGKLLVTYRF